MLTARDYQNLTIDRSIHLYNYFFVLYNGEYNIDTNDNILTSIGGGGGQKYDQIICWAKKIKGEEMHIFSPIGLKLTLSSAQPLIIINLFGEIYQSKKGEGGKNMNFKFNIHP